MKLTDEERKSVYGLKNWIRFKGTSVKIKTTDVMRALVKFYPESRSAKELAVYLNILTPSQTPDSSKLAYKLFQLFFAGNATREKKDGVFVYKANWKDKP